jgi:hypothetical protein
LSRELIKADSRAFIFMPTEEKRLSAMIPDAFMDLALGVSALRITSQHTSLKVLAKPSRIRQRKVWKGLFTLHIISGGRWGERTIKSIIEMRNLHGAALA